MGNRLTASFLDCFKITIILPEAINMELQRWAELEGARLIARTMPRSDFLAELKKWYDWEVPSASPPGISFLTHLLSKIDLDKISKRRRWVHKSHEAYLDSLERRGIELADQEAKLRPSSIESSRLEESITEMFRTAAISSNRFYSLDPYDNKSIFIRSRFWGGGSLTRVNDIDAEMAEILYTLLPDGDVAMDKFHEQHRQYCADHRKWKRYHLDWIVRIFRWMYFRRTR